MAQRPVPAMELLLATFFVTLLNLASPVFVIQVLNRYVTFGFDGTLVTLTVGMLVAVAMLYAFTLLRPRLAAVVMGDAEERLSAACHEIILRIRAQALGPEVVRAAHEVPARLATVRSAREPGIVMQVLDAPFALLYLLVTFLLSPLLALVGALGMVAVGVLAHAGNTGQSVHFRTLEHEEAERRRMNAAAIDGADTVRVFRAAAFVRRAWTERTRRAEPLRLRLAFLREGSKSSTATVVLLQSVAVYAIGAMQVVNGDISVGVLIGANILTSRAVGVASGFASAMGLCDRARTAQADLDRFLALPQEPASGTAKQIFQGRVEFRDVGFGWPGSHSPLFESLNVVMEPGMLTIVQGPNGSGKTTFARMLAGLVEPGRGDIVADGVTLRQIAPDWWRGQIRYLPQEPAFMPATIRENILMPLLGRQTAEASVSDGSPVLKVDAGTLRDGQERKDEAELNAVLNTALNAADLASYIFSLPAGLDTVLEDAGRTLSVGIRRRLALARAMVTDGRLVILDEPTEGLDAQGRKAALRCIVQMLREGRTVVVVSTDADLERVAGQKLDLGIKPRPLVARRAPAGGNGAVVAPVPYPASENGTPGPDAGTPLETVSGIGTPAQGGTPPVPPAAANRDVARQAGQIGQIGQAGQAGQAGQTGQAGMGKDSIDKDSAGKAGPAKNSSGDESVGTEESGQGTQGESRS